jgi:hypothetical protein
MRSRAVASLLTLTIMAVCLVSESTAQLEAPKPSGVVLPIRSTEGRLSGLFMLHHFVASENGGIVAVGVISGTVTGGGRRTTGRTFLQPVSLPVTQIKIGNQIRAFPISQSGFAPVPSGTRAVWDHEAPAPAPGIVLAQAQDCTVLSLTIGGIVLDVLGLQVDLDDIVLAITGDTGGLLGNLICSLLSVLSGLVDAIVGLLNAILGVLGGLTGGLGGGA